MASSRSCFFWSFVSSESDLGFRTGFSLSGGKSQAGCGRPGTFFFFFFFGSWDDPLVTGFFVGLVELSAIMNG